MRIPAITRGDFRDEFAELERGDMLLLSAIAYKPALPSLPMNANPFQLVLQAHAHIVRVLHPSSRRDSSAQRADLTDLDISPAYAPSAKRSSTYRSAFSHAARLRP